MHLTIVMPTLDEAEGIAQPLASALAEADEVLVVDGGSQDATRERAAASGARVLVGPAGRGCQLNLGARHAKGDVLLFLHADTRLPAGAGERVREAIRAGAVGGGFFLRFDSRRPVLRGFARMIGLRTRLTRCPLGDQAHFVRRDVFEHLGGYRDWPILEDIDFARRLARQGRVALLSPPVLTSGRRYLAGGPFRTVARNWLILALYFVGVSPHRLQRLYPRHRRPEGAGP